MLLGKLVFNHLYLFLQILHEKNHLSPRTLQVINNNLTSVMKEALSPKSEFWESGKTLRVLSEESYFKPDDSSDVVWPEALKEMMADSELFFWDIPISFG